MPEPPLAGVLDYVRAIGGAGTGPAPQDGQLLGDFVSRRDEGAFALLLERHGPLVLRTCQQILRDPQDAEDAFQAAFLVLARKAASVRSRETLAAWLHRVALNIARTVRRGISRRRALEQQAVPMAEVSSPDAANDWHALLHEEVNRLPHKYRAPVVLCYLQGKTAQEAAGELGWPVGSVKGRLGRARDRLRVCLTRRGVALSAALVATMPEAATAAVLPAALLTSTLRAAIALASGADLPTGAVSAHALTLAKGALHAMTVSRSALVTLMLLVLSGLGAGAAVWAATQPSPQTAAPPTQGPALALAPAEKAPPPAQEDDFPTDGPWGKPVDGLAARLRVRLAYAVGQPITAIVEIKNTSDKKRFLVPRLDPHAKEWLTLDITGPNGGKIAQGHYGSGYSLGQSSFEAINPGEVRRFEVPDLRTYFHELDAWTCYPVPRANAVTPGKYTLQFRYRSPKVPERFGVARRFVEGKEIVKTRAPAPELVAGQWAGEVDSAPVAFELKALGKDDLVVHEWGVFTIFNEAKYANANRKEEWGGLPSFFYRQFPTERLRWVPSAWDKPVVYFYAKPESLRISVKVTFTDGAPVVWWPAVTSPVNDGGFRTGRTPDKPRPFRSLTWEAWLGDRAPAVRGHGGLAKVEDFPLPADCWLKEARLPRATRLSVVGNLEGPPRGKMFPGAFDRSETERFLYYDGLVPAPGYLRCDKVEDDAITLRNRAAFAIPRLFVVDRRSKDTVRFAVVGGKDRPFEAGKTLRIELETVADWPAAGLKQVRQALIEAGLFEAEADVVLRIWRKRLLEADGVTVFHLMPAAEYDRMLPLEISPAPAARPVRVGIALHPHIEVEPDLAARVPALIRRLDDEDFAEREKAAKALLEIGPVAISLLRAELEKKPAPEVRRHIQAVLERVDAAEWLNLPATPPKPGK